MNSSAVCAGELPVFGADEPLRGVWVSTVYNLDYPSKAGLTPRALAEAIRSVDVTAPYDSKAVMDGLDRLFMEELGKMIGQGES